MNPTEKEKSAAPRGGGEELPHLTTLGQMLGVAAPLMVINVTAMLMQLVDALMVAPLGQGALAAVTPAGMFAWVPVSFGTGLCVSLNTFVSQSIGRGDRSGVGRYTWTMLSMVFGYAALVLGLLFLARPIFVLMGHEPGVVELEAQYFAVSLFLVAPSLGAQTLSSFYVAIHRPWVLAWWSLVAMVLNVGFNYVLIYGHFGVPALGLAGAALGTVLATWLQFLGLSLFFLSKRNAEEWGTRKVVFDKKAAGEMWRVGVPAGFQFMSEIFSWSVVMVWMVGLYGTAHLAATTIGMRIMFLSFMPALAVCSVLTSSVGRSIGAGLLDQAARQVKLTLVTNVCYMGTLGAMMILFAPQLCRLFTSDLETVRIASMVLVYVGMFQVFDATQLTCLHAMRGAGDTIWPACATFILCFVILILGGLGLMHFCPGLKSLNPWIAGTAYVMVLAVAFSLRWYRGPWRRMRIFEPSPAGV